MTASVNPLLRWRCAAALSAVLLVGGCATVVAPPLKQGDATPDLRGKGIALVGVTLANTFRVSPMISQIEVAGLFIDGPMGGPKPPVQFIDADKPVSRATADGRQVEERTLSIGLPPGKYRLRCVQTTVAKSAWGCAPVFATFEIHADAVLYLGHIDILRRERKNDSELRAGSVVPIFDQWYAGYSSGTFDVSIRDASDGDISRFRARYPFLATGMTITNAVLPPWRPPSPEEAGELP